VDEFDVILRARRVSGHLKPDQIPVSVESYVEVAGDLVLRYDDSLHEDEAGHTLPVGGKRCIVVNANDSIERKRFTICHELAHILLDLQTEHDGSGSQFVRRSPNEILCDVFAAELLLPYHLIQPRVEDLEIEFAAIDSLADEFLASRTATGSRFAVVCDRPCAFVLTQGGIVRYTSRSKSLRECGGWVPPGLKVPDASFAAHLLRSAQVEGPIEIAADEWFDDWRRGGVLMEDARHYPRWNQTLSLLWFEDDHIPASKEHESGDDDEEPALRELDGVLPWPGKSRRRP